MSDSDRVREHEERALQGNLAKEGEKLAEAFSFKGAPISFRPWSSLWVVIEQLMVQSPASLAPLDQFLFVQASFSPNQPTPPDQPAEFAGRERSVAHLPAPPLALHQARLEIVALRELEQRLRAHDAGAFGERAARHQRLLLPVAAQERSGRPAGAV